MVFILRVIAEVMDIVVDGKVVHIEFRDATPEKHREAIRKLHKGVEETKKAGVQKH